MHITKVFLNMENLTFVGKLRIQQRIKIHINLFTALLVSCIVGICWDSLVRYDRLTHRDGEHSLEHKNQ
ncbi:hypothetical protein KUTeg_008612, partial [Tegillarca granosa]